MSQLSQGLKILLHPVSPPSPTSAVPDMKMGSQENSQNPPQKYTKYHQKYIYTYIYIVITPLYLKIIVPWLTLKI
jgi:hypothetical protein